MIRITTLFLAMMLTLYLNGCGTSNQTKGAIGGATAGGVLGGVIGKQSDHTKQGAVIGAVVGGALGAVIGRRMDEQAQQLEDVPGVEDVSYDEEQQTIDARAEILFDVDKAHINPSEAIKLDELAAVFAQYPENIVVIEGHTDSDGTEPYNQTLSERRAQAIENYLHSKNLDIASISSVGYGESRPIAPNTNPQGKAQNRRVEIKISVDPNRVPQAEETNN
ncbi:MAG: OmpA family protein [Pseudomonadota bacterium]|nr:OmpA family protein [Pseudomonadota bacterium]